MTNFAYLRASTDNQDVKNQKFGVLDYSHTQNITPLKFIEDTMSGTASWRERPIGNLLDNATTGDKIIVSEVSRLGRSILQVLEILVKLQHKKAFQYILQKIA